MSRIIEVTDSDEERLSNSEFISKDAISDETGKLPIMSKTELKMSLQDSSASSSPIAKSSNQRRGRKSALETLRASPNMHFETVAVLSDASPSQELKKVKATVVTKPPPKSKSISVKIPANVPEKLADAEIEKLLSMDTIIVMREIAEERVRINYLLCAYGMQPIDFQLDSSPSTLEQLLKDRLRKYKVPSEPIDINADDSDKTEQQ